MIQSMLMTDYNIGSAEFQNVLREREWLKKVASSQHTLNDFPSISLLKTDKYVLYGSKVRKGTGCKTERKRNFSSAYQIQIGRLNDFNLGVCSLELVKPNAS